MTTTREPCKRCNGSGLIDDPGTPPHAWMTMRCPDCRGRPAAAQGQGGEAVDVAEIVAAAEEYAKQHHLTMLGCHPEFSDKAKAHFVARLSVALAPQPTMGEAERGAIIRASREASLAAPTTEIAKQVSDAVLRLLSASPAAPSPQGPEVDDSDWRNGYEFGLVMARLAVAPFSDGSIQAINQLLAERNGVVPTRPPYKVALGKGEANG